VALPAEQHHHGVGLGGDEAQQEDVAAAAVVALEHRLAQRAVLVQGHLLALGPHQVVHDVAGDETHDDVNTLHLYFALGGRRPSDASKLLNKTATT